MYRQVFFFVMLVSQALWAAPHYGDVRIGVFVPRCSKCHTGPGASADLDLLSYKSLQASGVVMAGKADDSTLMQRVVAGEMPEGGPPLTPAEMKLIREWIDDGARDVPPASSLFLKSLQPTFGSTAGGTMLELEGSVLSGVKNVWVGGKPCLDVQVHSDQRITCKVPPGAVAGKVTVRLEDESRFTELTDSFEYRPELNGTYQSLAMNIFGPRCIKCHSGARPPKDLDLSSYHSLLRHRRAVFAFDAKRSRIYKKVADGEMPKDSDPLSPDEIAAIADWIRAGAKND